MLKWFVADYSLKDNVYKVIGSWPNGMAVQIDVGMTENLEETLRKINEASAVSYMRMAEGFLLNNVQFKKESEGSSEGVPERTGTGDSGNSETKEGKVQV